MRGGTLPGKDDTAAIFARPTRANIKWSDIESLFVSLGAVVEEGDGSRVHFDLNGFGATFHRPHVQKETRRYAVIEVRKLLVQAGHSR